MLLPQHTLRVHPLHSIVATVILEIVQCGHPVLREKGQRVERVTAEIRRLAADMLETMYAARGVGLAAQQVGRAIQLTVIDVRQTDQPSELWRDNQPQDIATQMPLVLLNPRITESEGDQLSEEGCLSFPEISAPIRRALRVRVQAQDLDLRPVRIEATGLLARALQHETDHLNGILFVDRMDVATRAQLHNQIRKLQKETQARLRTLR